MGVPSWPLPIGPNGSACRGCVSPGSLQWAQSFGHSHQRVVFLLHVILTMGTSMG